MEKTEKTKKVKKSPLLYTNYLEDLLSSPNKRLGDVTVLDKETFEELENHSFTRPLATSFTQPLEQNKRILKMMKDEIENPLNYFNVEYNKKHRQLVNTLNANDTINHSKEDSINLKKGRFRGAKVPKVVIDKAIEAAEDTGLPVGKMLSLIGRESTFGAGRGSTDEESYLKDLVSGHTINEDYRPQEVGAFLYNKKAPSVLLSKGKMGYTYPINPSSEELKTFINKHPKLLEEYKASLAKTPVLPQNTNSFKLAAKKIKTKGIKAYNPEDSNYEADYNKDYSLLSTEPELQNYLKMKNVKYKNGGTAGFDLTGLASNAKPILDGLMSLLDGTPQYSDQPIINASTMRNMKTPYSSFGLGGKVNINKVLRKNKKVPFVDRIYNNKKYPVRNNPDGSYSTHLMASASDDVGAFVYPVLRLDQDNNWVENDDPTEALKAKDIIRFNSDDEAQYFANNYKNSRVAKRRGFAMGGSVEDYSEEELFELQQQADELGISIEEFIEMQNNGLLGLGDEEEEEIYEEEESVDEEDYSQDYYALGGQVPIEVEGEEVMETPNGNLKKVVGPKHEQGGVDTSVPKGTNIYSDRLSVDGKTMAERKVNREKNLAKLEKLGETSSSTPTRNTIKRTSQTIEMEEQKDMALQQIANKLYGEEGEAKYGSDTDPLYDRWDQYLPETPYYPDMPIQQLGVIKTSGAKTIPNITIPDSLGKLPPTTITPNNTNNVNTDENNGNPLSAGDYLGMAGNLFNAIAPIVNTRNAAKNSKPNINRYRGFGREALETNKAAQDYANTMRSNAKVNLASSNNSAFARNRGGARSVNTMRALDIATNVGANKATNDIDNAFSQQMIGLLGQEGQLENMQDQMEMRGQTDVDIRDQQDLDNYYSNMAQNLTNAGTNIQGLGRSLNQSKGNQDDLDLMALLTENGIRVGRNKKGKWSIQNNG